jgi:hypothetical protein
MGTWRRWHNSTGTQLWPDYGDVFGAFPKKSKQKGFYALLLRHLFKKHGYVPGVNLFNIPFDWRTGVQGLEQVGGGCSGCSYCSTAYTPPQAAVTDRTLCGMASVQSSVMTW